VKFGQTDHTGNIPLQLPDDHPRTRQILAQADHNQPLDVCVGCAKWNRTDLKNFYPKGVKDELSYYATQFNSIELNATFYGMFSGEQVEAWKDKTPANFRFFPKINRSVSHMRRLLNIDELLTAYCDNISRFEEQLGMVFLQLHENFGYKNFERLQHFAEVFPAAIPLAVEVRHPEWFSTPAYADRLAQLLEQRHATNIIVDTAGRRDMLHMRLTAPYAFIRYVGANDPAEDRKRLDDWLFRLKQWVDAGLRNIGFFVHQNEEVESPRLAAYFIEKLNGAFGTALKIPQLQEK
jgi:uncharacterized protein YecE (DUF72 family)